MIATPFLAPIQPWPLNAPELLGRRAATSRYPLTRLLHFFGEGVEDTYYQHCIGTAIEAGMYSRCDLMAAIGNASMWKHDTTTATQQWRKIPQAGLLKLADGSRFAKGDMLGGVLNVNLLLKAAWFEGHEVFLC